METQLFTELDSLYQVMYTFNYGDDSTGINDFESFETKINQVTELAKENQIYPPYYKGKNLFFIHLKYQEERQKAIRLLDETIQHAKDRFDSAHMARFIYLKGNLVFRFDEFDSAVYYFNESLSIGKDLNNTVLQAAAINAIAVCFAQLDRDEEAIKYYKESMDLAENIKDEKQILTAALNLGNAYGRIEMADSALYFSEIAYEKAKEQNEVSIKWRSLNALAVANFLKLNYEKTIFYSKELEKEVLPIGETGFLMTSYLARSKGLNAMGQKDESLRYAQKSLALSYEYGAVDNEKRTLLWLIDLAAKLGNYKSALDHQQRLTFIEDSLNNIQVNRRLESLSAQYEAEKRQVEIEGLEIVQQQLAEKLKFKNLMFIFLALSAFAIMITLVLFYKRRVEKERMAKEKTKNDLLRTQLNPHFLFNALSSIQLFLINQGQGFLALEYLSKFAKLMRRILENSRKDFVSLEDEISTLRHYLDLQKMRFDNGFEYKIDVQVDGDLSEIKIPPMFAQPFIENSLEHGISSLKDGRILISFEQHKDLMRFRVEDNGIGISRAAAMKQNDGHVSMATKITKDRIELLRQQLKKNISFIIKDRLNDTNEVIGTEVIFEIPIQY